MEEVISLLRNHSQFRAPGSENSKLQISNSKDYESNMKTSDFILLVLAIVLIAGMILTAVFGRGSRHGYGMAPPQQNPAFWSVFTSQPVTIT